MTDSEIHNALICPLEKIVKELSICSVDVQNLIRMSLSGSHSEPVIVPHITAVAATMKLNKAICQVK